MVKRSKRIIQQPKTIANPDIIEIKAVTIEYPKTSCKISETIRHQTKTSQGGGAGKGCTSPLYSEATKNDSF